MTSHCIECGREVICGTRYPVPGETGGTIWLYTCACCSTRKTKVKNDSD